MSTTDVWHLDPGDLDRYVRGDVGPALEASVDAHLLRCGECRAEVNGRLTSREPARNDARWARIADEIDRPTPSRIERVLGRLGLPEVDLRTLVATPRLAAAWTLALSITLAMAIVASRVTNGRPALTLFLVVAPVLPMAGTALLYAPATEPPGSIAIATPGRGPRLLLARSLFVLATSVPVLLAAGLMVPGPSSVAVAWVLPGLALTLVPLAVARWWDPVRSAILLGTAWAAAITLTAFDLPRLPMAEFARRLLPLRPAIQIMFALVASIAGALALAQRNLLPAREAR